MHVELPRHELPRPVPMSLDEVEMLMNAPEPGTALGLRDKAMLELLYGAGIRVTELLGMRVSDAQPSLGYVRIVSPRNKERIVPLGRGASGWMALYIQEGRPRLREDKSGAPISTGGAAELQCR